MKFLKTLALPAVLTVALAGCGGSNEHADTYHAANGDLRETTASVETLPSFLDGQHEIIANTYLIAGQTAELLDWIPCYCGCGESAGHLSSKNCFIHEIKEDGSAVWDDHGTRCNVCVSIALESAAMLKKGMSVRDIRDAIDSKYGEGYAAPTPTPMPL